METKRSSMDILRTTNLRNHHFVVSSYRWQANPYGKFGRYLEVLDKQHHVWGGYIRDTFDSETAWFGRWVQILQAPLTYRTGKVIYVGEIF